jgi:hypothetical protein
MIRPNEHIGSGEEIAMRRVFNALLAVIALLLATHSALPVSAQGSAYNTNFITSITYQNVGTATANITFTFYPTSGGTPISFSRTLAANAGASLNVGSTSELSGFSGQGSAVISSDQPIVATVVQLPQNANVRNRPLSNGFGSNDGSNNVLIATVLKNTFNQTTKFSIQNADTTNVNVTLRFFAVGSATPTHTETFSLNVGTARFFDAGTISQLGTSFNGSATIQATGKVVATAIEATTDTSYKVSAFEGVAQGSNTVYMPSALCNFGSTQQRSAYAVQNTSTTNSTTVTVTYKDTNNNTVATQTANIPANAKFSFQTCSASGIPSNFSGSATITSSGAPIVAIGKVFSGSPAYAALATAFVGASAGASKLAAPYVRWTQTRFDINPGNRQRAFIAIQNVGSGASGTITVKYYDLNGNLIGTHTISSINSGQKTNSTPIAATPAAGKTTADLAEFGYIGGFGGSATIECAGTGCQIVAVVRIASANSATNTADIVAEDYNAIPIN